MSAPFVGANATLIALAIAAQPAAAGVIEVHLKEQRFEPKIVSAKPGDTIIFYNDDNELHSVLLPDNQTLLAEHFIDPHARYEVVIPTATDPAIYNLVCTIHLNMQGAVQIMAR
jgi:plastocyanin